MYLGQQKCETFSFSSAGTFFFGLPSYMYHICGNLILGETKLLRVDFNMEFETLDEYSFPYLIACDRSLIILYLSQLGGSPFPLKR